MRELRGQGQGQNLFLLSEGISKAWEAWRCPGRHFKGGGGATEQFLLTEYAPTSLLKHGRLIGWGAAEGVLAPRNASPKGDQIRLRMTFWGATNMKGARLRQPETRGRCFC